MCTLNYSTSVSPVFHLTVMHIFTCSVWGEIPVEPADIDSGTGR